MSASSSETSPKVVVSHAEINFTLIVYISIQGLRVVLSIFPAWIWSPSLGITSGHLISDGLSSPTIGNHGVNSMKKSTKSWNRDDPGTSINQDILIPKSSVRREYPCLK
ncbi:hypothetical protein BYT27DRAFT_6854162 [Phlegmacium glaucopus]|nr:hypothetical protein BYT27DRAFT_6854162 [Phlegmacium glaucopus]